MNSAAPEFTVFTASHNRAHTLHRVYDSLAAQTFRDFEWLIVDDGSTDATRDRVAAWQRSAGFPIRYVFQVQQGKAAAFNHGVDLAGGALFVSVDSDDAILPHALQTLHDRWQAIPAGQRAQFAGVTALCANAHGTLVSRPLDRDVLDCTYLESRYLYKDRGDKWGFKRTDLLRQFPFPRLPGCTHIPDAYVWSSLARAGYKTRYINEALHVYYVPAARAGDHLSTNGQLGIRNPEAYVLRSQAVLEHDLRLNYLWHDPQTFLRMAVHFVRYGLHGNVPLWTRIRHLANTRARLAALIGLLPGAWLYLRDRWRRTRRAAPLRG